MTRAAARWVARAPAHRKVALLAGVLLVLMVTVSVVGVAGLRGVNGDLDRVTRRTGPAELALADVSTSILFAQLALEQSEVLVGDAVDLAKLDEFDAAITRSADDWERFRALAVDVGVGEIDTTRFAAAQAAWADRATAARDDLASGNAMSPETQLVVRARFDAVEAELQQLAQQYRAVLEARGADAVHRGSLAQSLLVAVAALGLMAGFAISRSSYRASLSQHRELAARDAARELEAGRRGAESRLNRALEQIQNEDDAVGTVALALREMLPGRASELLLADSSNAHLRVVAATDGFDDRPGCGVSTPRQCPAVNKSRTLLFDTSSSFDSCPHLRNRAGTPSSAVCVPVAINGTASGVLHSIAPEGTVVEGDQQRLLELVASRAGDRIGVLRAFSRSEAQAATDPLTGLDNRRSFENRAASLLASGRSVALAFGDLDHFKRLNDTHGHDMGDRALRAFARTVRHTVRPDDLVARWGGEEFVLVLPDTTREVAATVLDRVRVELARVVAAGGIPSFTVSFGVSDRLDGDDLESLVEAADRALLHAKALGRDRVVVSGTVDEVAISQVEA